MVDYKLSGSYRVTSMIREEQLAKEFVSIVDRFYPEISGLLDRCHVKVINSSWGKPPQHFQYIGIYSPDRAIASITSHREAFRDIAHNMGFADVVCINATRLLKDPMSKLRREDPRFWLEIQWISTTKPF